MPSSQWHTDPCPLPAGVQCSGRPRRLGGPPRPRARVSAACSGPPLSSVLLAPQGVCSGSPCFVNKTPPAVCSPGGLSLRRPRPLAGWPLAKLLTGSFSVFVALQHPWPAGERWVGRVFGLPIFPSLHVAHLLAVHWMLAECLVPSSPEQWLPSTTGSTRAS